VPCFSTLVVRLYFEKDVVKNLLVSQLPYSHRECQKWDNIENSTEGKGQGARILRRHFVIVTNERAVKDV
jgi:hypothetical protein